MLATRCVQGLRGLQYPARLRELKVPSMEHHILRATLIMAYTLFYGNLNLHLNEFFDAPGVNHHHDITLSSDRPDPKSNKDKLLGCPLLFYQTQI